VLVPPADPTSRDPVAFTVAQKMPANRVLGSNLALWSLSTLEPRPI
jgi:hypothetical protein